jgi:ATP-dependent Clp protease adaptor protein ClpS
MSEEATAAVEEQASPQREAERARPSVGTKDETVAKRQPKYHVILWNDEDHSYPYVMVMLQKLFGYPLERGFQLADEVDKQGRCIVLTTTLEHAELKRDQIHAFGKDKFVAGCQGSMSSSIEPDIS